jgi:hypothetical protein
LDFGKGIKPIFVCYDFDSDPIESFDPAVCTWVHIAGEPWATRHGVRVGCGGCRQRRRHWWGGALPTGLGAGQVGLGS